MNPTVRLSMENYSIHYHIIWCCTDLQPWLKLGCSLTSKTTFVKSHAGKETTKFTVLVRNRLFGVISPFLYCLKSLHQCTAAAYDEGEFSEHWVIFMLRVSNQHAELKHTVLKIRENALPSSPWGHRRVTSTALLFLLLLLPISALETQVWLPRRERDPTAPPPPTRSFVSPTAAEPFSYYYCYYYFWGFGNKLIKSPTRCDSEWLRCCCCSHGNRPRSGDLAGPEITVTPNQARAARAAACHPAVGIQRIAIFHGAPVHICIPSPGFPSPCPPSHPFLAGSAPAVS